MNSKISSLIFRHHIPAGSGRCLEAVASLASCWAWGIPVWLAFWESISSAFFQEACRLWSTYPALFSEGYLLSFTLFYQNHILKASLKKISLLSRCASGFLANTSAWQTRGLSKSQCNFSQFLPLTLGCSAILSSFLFPSWEVVWSKANNWGFAYLGSSAGQKY